MTPTICLRIVAVLLLAVVLVWFWGRYALFPPEMTTGNARFVGWGIALLAGYGSYRFWMKAAELREDCEDVESAHE